MVLLCSFLGIYSSLCIDAWLGNAPPLTIVRAYIYEICKILDSQGSAYCAHNIGTSGVEYTSFSLYIGRLKNGIGADHA